MAEFVYNNAKNASNGFMFFELNYGYHLWVFYKENINPCFKIKLANKLLAELQKLLTVCWENLYHTKELQKQAHNKGVKFKSYTLNNKVWLNSRYIKAKQNQKVKAKFFELFWVLYLIGKQAYKFKLPKK